VSPHIWVNARPEDRPVFEAAVESGGGVVSDAAVADAVVWAVDDPPSIRPYLTSQVRWVQLSSAGIEDWFDAGVIDQARIWTAAKGVYAEPIAEYALAMMLAAARRLPEVVGDATWQPRDVSSLAGATVGIVGAGGIGRALLRLLAPLGTHTIALTRGGRAVPGADESVGPDGLDGLLRRSDYVVLASPETAETIGLISAKEIASLQPHAWVINVGRGSILDTEALVRALAGGRIGGAALDVTSPEPLPDRHPLWQFPNVIVTSHTASTRRLGRDRLARRIQANVDRFSRGRELLGAVDVGLGY
jgi:phosphoglycerate dehydrogenase-like enzyme